VLEQHALVFRSRLRGRRSGGWVRRGRFVLSRAGIGAGRRAVRLIVRVVDLPLVFGSKIRLIGPAVYSLALCEDSATRKSHPT
jgi:hypothetical protein